MRTKYFQTEFGSEHKRFFEQLDEITTEYFQTDDPEDAEFELFGKMYMIDEPPEIIVMAHKLLDEWNFSKIKPLALCPQSANLLLRCKGKHKKERMK